MPNTFRSLIDRCAYEYPDREYLADPDAGLVMTFGQLRTYCIEFAAQLNSIGLTQSSNIAFLLDNGYWTVTAFLGTVYAGHVTVPLNAVASKKNLVFALTNSNADVVFTSTTYRLMLDEIVAESNREIEIVMVDLEEGFDLPAADGGSSSDLLLDISADSPAMILHTSGTVGLPKGAVLTHENLIAGGRNVVLAHELTEHDAAYCVLPLYHINGEVVATVAPLVSGSRVVMPRKFSTTSFWRHVEEHQCTWLSVVPTMSKFLLNQAHSDGFSSERYHHLRFARSASSAMPAGMHEDFEETFGVPMIETMGLTETAAPILANPMPPAPRKSGSVGIPFGDEVMIVSGEFEELPTNEVGEIVVQGANVIREYYNAPEATASSFTPDGWFRTGDLGYRDEDGYFFVTGRIKELIIKGGENISPREVDDVLYHHKAVQEAGTFGMPDDIYGQIVAVAVVLKEGQESSEEELIKFCKEQLGSFRCPSKIIFMSELPKGPSGKIQRLEIAKLLVESGDA